MLVRRPPCPDAALPSTGFQGHFGGYERDLALVHGAGVLLLAAILGWLLTQISARLWQKEKGKTPKTKESPELIR